jgi:hypothetical protein
VAKNWIKGAIKHPGALRATVKAKYGAKGFSGDNIKASILSSLATKGGTVGKRARLAQTLKGMHHKTKVKVKAK